MKEKTVEELEKDVEEHENKLRDIELEIEAEDAVIPRGFAKDVYSDKRRVRPSLPHSSPVPQLVPDMHSGQEKEHCTQKDKSDRGVLVFSIDYIFLNCKDSLADPVLVMTESESGGVSALLVKKERELHLLHQQSYR